MIAIKDMEMPKSCIECEEKGIRFVNHCQLIFDTKADIERHPDCPLKEIVTCKNCRFKHRTSDFHEAEYQCRKYLQAEIDGDFYCRGGRRE